MTETEQESVVVTILERRKSEYRTIKEGTIICPETSRRGVLQEDVVAEGLKRKIKGFPGWRAKVWLPMYFDNERWELAPGTTFGAPRGSDRKMGGPSSRKTGSRK